ncbi:uncharacterized protein [Nicotiana tomentosiformis]|uniref:uncharacterized protein n=1 Tax=Nicotiana tomentosiformis TaxID=4098 RepID=UPI00388C5A40
MSYADHRVRDVEFMVGERVLLRVSPMKGVMRFRKKEKLRSRFIDPFEILERVGEVAYRLALTPSLSAVHPVFHVSMLRKYHGDLSYVLDFSSVPLDKDLTSKKEPMAILAWKMRSKSYPSVSVQWRDSVKLKAGVDSTQDQFSSSSGVNCAVLSLLVTSLPP